MSPLQGIMGPPGFEGMIGVPGPQVKKCNLTRYL